MAVTVPSFIPIPWAQNGQTATIPQTTAEKGRASWDQGFPQVCALPLSAYGIPPNYLDFQGVLNALSSSICYMQTGALWPWSSTLTYPLGAHVLGSDNNEYVAVQENTNHDPTQDATNVYWLRADAGDGVPVGTIVWSAATQAPNGYLLCNGATVGRTTYSALFAAIGTTYGAGDGSTTFALPNLIGRVMWGGTSPGQYLEAGLPGFGGSFQAFASVAATGSGVFSQSIPGSGAKKYNIGTLANSSGGEGFTDVTINPDSIYGNSDTVQPPALTLCPYIKAFSAATNQGMIDLTSLANDVAALDAERLKNIGKIETFAVTNIPDGWMICDGSSVLFADWPEFQQVYNEGRFNGMTLSAADPAQKGKFVLNGSTGVYLPDLTGLFVQASAAGTAGAYVAPGVPNISGSVGGLVSPNSGGLSLQTDGFSSTKVASVAYGGRSTGSSNNVYFSGNSANSIYSDTVTTVQPPTVQYVMAMYLGKPAAAA